MLDQTHPLPPTQPLDLLRTIVRGGRDSPDVSVGCTYVVRSPGGHTHRDFSWDEQTRAQIDEALQAQPRLEDLERVGLKLYDLLGDVYDAALQADVRTPVRIGLELASPELYSLPFELMRSPDNDRSLTAPNVLIRYKDASAHRVPLGPDENRDTGRILFGSFGADLDTTRDQQLSALESACRRAQVPFDRASDVVELSHQNLKAKLDAPGEGGPFSVLHVLCHGEPLGSEREGYGLLWADGTSPGKGIARLLAPYASNLRLVVLSSCVGGRGAPSGLLDSAALALHKAGVETIVAVRTPITPEAAVRLTEVLYQELLVGSRSIEDAFLAAREALSLQWPNGLDHVSLQLFVADLERADTRPFVFRPYRGLLAFHPEHRRFFFGRDKEIKELEEDLAALATAGEPQLLIVEGASGTGKSSVVLAGLVPRLEQVRAWVRVVPGADPLAALDAALTMRPAVGTPWLLVVDQLEELFTQTPDDEAGRAARDRFTRRLWSLAAEPGVQVVATMRTDFRGRCGEVHLDDERRMDHLFTKGQEGHAVFVAQLAPDQLRDVIVCPAQRVGLSLDDGLVEQMLADVGAEPGALPLLEYTLDLLWQHRQSSRLSAEAYTQIGGVGGALKGKAEALYSALDTDQQRAARRMLVRLVEHRGEQTPDTRRRARLADLRPAAEPQAKVFDVVVTKLVDARLLVRSETGGAPAVEVAHEALIRHWDALKGWVSEDRDMLVELDRVEGWVKEWREFPDRLLSGAQLGYASEVCIRYSSDVSPDGHALVADSRAREEGLAMQARRRLWRGITAACAAALVFAVLGGLAWWLRGVAKDEAVHARDQARMVAVREAISDPTLQAMLLREVEAPDVTRAWRQNATDVVNAVRSVAVLAGHQKAVVAVAFSPDGSRVVTASEDGTARVWSATGMGESVLLSGHQGPVRDVSFSPDGHQVVTASDDGSAWVWHADGEGAPRKFKGHKGPVTAASFSPDGKWIVTASRDDTTRVWRADGQGEVVVLTGHKDDVLSAQFSPDGRRIVTASADNTVIVWMADGSGVPVRLEGHTDVVTSAAFSPDGMQVISASADRTARIWAADGSGEAAILKDHDDYVNAASFSPRGDRIVTASADGWLRIWRPGESETNRRIYDRHPRGLTSARFSPDGEWIVYTSYDHTSQVVRADGTGDPISLLGHTDYVNSAQFSPDGGRVVTASSDGTARVWRIEEAQTPVILLGSKAWASSGSFSPSGDRVVCSVSEPTARVWWADGARASVLLSGHSALLNSAQFSQDGTLVVTASNDMTARVWRADGTGPPVQLTGHTGEVNFASFSPDGERVVTASDDRTARIWRADGGGGSIKLAGHLEKVNSARFSPDGVWVVTASDDGTARIWRADEPTEARAVLHHGVAVNDASFSPDGAHVVTASDDRTARVWTVDGKTEPVILDGHLDSVNTASFSPDGALVVTSSYDETARVWESDGTGTPLVLRGHKDEVISAVFSADGRRVLATWHDGTDRVWTLFAVSELTDLLWSSTSSCLPPKERTRLLGESDEESEARYATCTAMVAAYAAKGAYNSQSQAP